jgi:very-short-patch-repair endonuclease
VAAALATWGVLRRTDLRAAGVGSNTIDRWCASGRLHHLYRGVYSLLPKDALAPEGRDLAAVWACGDDAVLASLSAAVRWGLLRFGPPRPQVLVQSTGRKAIDGINLRVTKDLPDDDRTVKDAIPITTVERTILDLAAATAQVSDRALESAAAQAERDGWLRRPAQLRTAARARHRTGSARLRTVLRVGPRLWRSDEEAMAAAAIVEAGLPEPVIAHRVRSDIGVLEVDLSFPDHRLILEVDGGQHALTLNAARDVDRDAALDRLGWLTVRVSAAAVRADPTAAVRVVRPALEGRG